MPPTTNFFQKYGLDARLVRLALGPLILFGLVFIVYRPILPGQLLMDDWRLIQPDNPLTNGELTPLNLWFQTDFTLSTFALWLEHLLWGQNPACYHVVNLLLHAVSAVLIWRLLVQLKIPAAWLAAALFAVHPVCVNSVARAAEIKNTLSLPFFLLSLWAYLHYERLALYPTKDRSTALPHSQANLITPATGWLVIALFAFIAALLSKTSTIMLPPILLACAAWQRNRIGRKDWLHIAPFFVLAVAFGLMSIWFQKHQALFSAGETLAPETFWQRLALAGHVLGFYLGKALWPVKLNLVYPQWKLDAASVDAWLPVVVFVLAALLCWRFRQRWGRPVLFGLACYAITLFPVLGFFESQFLTRWQVSDHLQYLPLIAPVAFLAAVLATSLNPSVFRLISLVLLTGFAILTYQRAMVFTSDEAIMRDAIGKNPDASYARDKLGVILAKRGDFAGALDQFKTSAKASPADADALSNLAHLLAVTGKYPAAEASYRAALKLEPYDADTHRNFAQLLRQEGRNRESIFHYQVALQFKPDNRTRLEFASLLYQTGNLSAAAVQYRRAVAEEPNNVEALNNLAWLLATAGDDTVRNGVAAVLLAEKACKLTVYKQARLTGTLAASYAEAGRYAEAVTLCQTTMELARNAGDQRSSDISGQLLNLYRDNRPYHEPEAPDSSGL